MTGVAGYTGRPRIQDSKLMQITYTTMKRYANPITALAILGLLAACGGESTEPVAGTDGDWQNLLDGDSLSGWTEIGDANWHFEEGAIVADESGDASFLVSDAAYSDFELELEFWVDTDANSGIFLRCSDRSEITDTNCYEANIFDTRTDQTYRTGSIVNIAEPAEFVYTGEQWNRYRIRAEGQRLQIELNGRALVDVEDGQLASGPIALQYGMGTVKFRNVRIRAL
jgi:hypothetical protein